jgi:hypothetical protein
VGGVGLVVRVVGCLDLVEVRQTASRVGAWVGFLGEGQDVVGLMVFVPRRRFGLVLFVGFGVGLAERQVGGAVLFRLDGIAFPGRGW